jgi:hypothetical protein
MHSPIEMKGYLVVAEAPHRVKEGRRRSTAGDPRV